MDLKKACCVAFIAFVIAIAAYSLAQFNFVDKLSSPPTACTNFTFLQSFGGNSTICNTVPLQGTLSFFFTNQTSINTLTNNSKRMLSSPDNATDTIISYPGLSDGQNFQNWTTRQGLPELSFIPGGIYFLHMHASIDKPGFAMMFAEVWEVNNTGGLIQLIGTTEHEVLGSSSETEYDMEFSRNTTVFLNSTQSRIQVRFFIHILQDSPAPTLYFDGSTNARLSLPSVTVDASNFMPYTGWTQDPNGTPHNLTINNLVANNITSPDITNLIFNDSLKVNKSGDNMTGLLDVNVTTAKTNTPVSLVHFGRSSTSANAEMTLNDLNDAFAFRINNNVTGQTTVNNEVGWTLALRPGADTASIARTWAGTATSNDVLSFNGNTSVSTFGNLSAKGGTNIVYRCTVAGNLRIGQLTTVNTDCGTAVDTGLRVN